VKRTGTEPTPIPRGYGFCVCDFVADIGTIPFEPIRPG
jgi:hypothetical protein